MLRFGVGVSLTHQLGRQAVAFPQLPTHAAHVRDRPRQALGHHGSTLVDTRGHHQPQPCDMLSAPALATVMGLALHGVDLVCALAAHAPGFAHQEPIGRAIGTSGELVEHVTVQLLPEPGLQERLGIGGGA
jgi:hypothetical protein